MVVTLAATLERFSVPEPNTGCFLWLGNVDRKGYAMAYFDGKVRRVARAVLAERLGEPLPDGIFACHHCDVPGCVNADHLFPGTNSDNIKDCARKGRMHLQKHPELNAASKLTIEDVALIRATYLPKHRQRGAAALARRFSVSKPTIAAAIHSRTYRWRQ